MPMKVETLSRRIAVGALLASAAFFAWWGVALAASFGAALPFFAGLVVAWVVAAVGVDRGRAWGPGFATGMSALAVVVMLPAGMRWPVTLFLSAQVILLSALTVRSFAAEHEPNAWRHSSLAFSAGLATPWLLLVGFLPGLDLGGSLLGMLACGVGASGVAAAFRGRTWGILAMLGAIPLLVAIPESAWACVGGPHDRAGELAALALALATTPWLGPIAKHFMKRDPA